MKLLSPSVIKQGQSQQTEREILRTQEVQKIADKTRKELANSEADFRQALLGQRARWEREEQDHTKRVNEAVEEIKVLESRKAQALIPIEVYKKQAETLMQEAQDGLRLVQGRELEAEELLDTLQDKLDAVGQREQDSIIKEKRLFIKEEAIKSQETLTSNKSEELTRAWIDFNKDKELAEFDIRDRKTALFLRDRSQEAREDALNRQEQELKDWSIKLKDERDTLDRAFARISPLKKKKKGL
jgi:hypothetical protein